MSLIHKTFITLFLTIILSVRESYCQPSCENLLFSKLSSTHQTSASIDVVIGGPNTSEILNQLLEQLFGSGPMNVQIRFASNIVRLRYQQGESGLLLVGTLEYNSTIKSYVFTIFRVKENTGFGSHEIDAQIIDLKPSNKDSKRQLTNKVRFVDLDDLLYNGPF